MLSPCFGCVFGSSGSLSFDSVAVCSADACRVCDACSVEGSSTWESRCAIFPRCKRCNLSCPPGLFGGRPPPCWWCRCGIWTRGGCDLSGKRPVLCRFWAAASARRAAISWRASTALAPSLWY